MDSKAHNLCLIKTLQRRWQQASEEQRSVMLKVSKKSRDEVRAGVSDGPFTLEEVYQRMDGSKVYALDRFARRGRSRGPMGRNGASRGQRISTSRTSRTSRRIRGRGKNALSPSVGAVFLAVTLS